MKKHYFLIILLAAVLIRFINLSQPLLEGAATRQVENAMIARNFYQENFNILYPHLNSSGKDPVYQLVEFQLLPFFGAMIYRILGGVYESVLRCISIFFFVLSSIFLYKFAKYHLGRTMALCAVTVFSFSPISIYLGRAFHYEMAVIFFVLATVYYFSLWMDREKLVYMLLAVACFSMALLLKIISFYIAPVLIFLAVWKYKGRTFKKKELYVFAAAVLPLVVLWYLHASAVMNKYPNKYSFYYDNTLAFMWKMITFWLPNPLFYKLGIDNLVNYALTPIGFALAIFGFFTKTEDRKELLIYIWLLSVCLLFAIAPAEASQGYYQVYFLIPCGLLIGKSVARLMKVNFFDGGILNKRLSLSIILIIALVSAARYSVGFYKVPDNLHHVVEAGKEIQHLTEKEALVIASVENSSELLYYCDRSGWPFTIDMEAARDRAKSRREDISKRIYDPVAILEQLRKEGASYFVSASKQNEFLKNEIFSKYMIENYKVAGESPNYIIFDLRK